MAHISDELYREATTEYIKANASTLAKDPLIREQVQARHHDKIIEVAEDKYQERRQANVCGT